MSEENTTTTTSTEGGQQQVQAFVDDRDLRTVYCNFYNFRNTAQEVIMELGFQMGNPPQQAGGQPQLLIKLTDRVVLNYQNTKRLAASLTQLVRWYEQQYGEINITPPKK